MKTCITCQVEKPETEFYLRGLRAGIRRNGLVTECKKCQNKRSIAWRAANQENRAKSIKTQRNWQRKNAAKVTAYVNTRRATKLKATPAWANQFFIDEIYDLAALRTKLTGSKWEVDHIVPLKSPLVCGLHVEHNLRVIEKQVNRDKGNRLTG